MRDYERELWHLRNENQQRREVVATQLDEIKALQRARGDVEGEMRRVELLRGENARLSAELSTNQRQLMAATADVRNLRDSGAGRIADAVQHTSRVVAPPGSRRQRSLHRMVRAADRPRPRGAVRAAQGGP